MTPAVRTVLLAVVLAGRSAMLSAQDPGPDEVHRTLRAQPVDRGAWPGGGEPMLESLGGPDALRLLAGGGGF